MVGSCWSTYWFLHRLSKGRRKRPIPKDWATNEVIESFKIQTTSEKLYSGDTFLAVDEAGKSVIVGGSDGVAGIYSIEDDKLQESFKAGKLGKNLEQKMLHPTWSRKKFQKLNYRFSILMLQLILRDCNPILKVRGNFDKYLANSKIPQAVLLLMQSGSEPNPS